MILAGFYGDLGFTKCHVTKISGRGFPGFCEDKFRISHAFSLFKSAASRFGMDLGFSGERSTGSRGSDLSASTDLKGGHGRLRWGVAPENRANHSSDDCILLSILQQNLPSVHWYRQI